MAVERVSGGSSLIDVLDRVLDKGIVIDAWVRISLVGIDLITVEARVVVASIDTYLKYADAVGLVGLVSRPQLSAAAVPEIEMETTRRVSRVPEASRAAAQLSPISNRQLPGLPSQADYGLALQSNGQFRAKTQTRAFPRSTVVQRVSCSPSHCGRTP